VLDTQALRASGCAFLILVCTVNITTAQAVGSMMVMRASWCMSEMRDHTAHVSNPLDHMCCVFVHSDGMLPSYAYATLLLVLCNDQHMLVYG
jgi:hypothetical protein